MRIALLTRRFDPRGGGTERDLIVTAECLRAAGHEVTIFAGELRATSEFKVRRVGGISLGRTAGLLSFAYGAPRAARREGADLVLSFARTIGADVMRSGGSAHISYLRAARKWRGALQWSVMRASPYHRAQTFIERVGFGSPGLKAAIAVSNLVREDLIREFRLPAEKVITLYNGVDLDRFTPPSDDSARREIRSSLDINDGAPLVAFVGNGFGRKGLRFLIDAWPKVGHGAHLMVVGADQKSRAYRRAAIRLGVGERIHFEGPVPDVNASLSRGRCASATFSVRTVRQCDPGSDGERATGSGERAIRRLGAATGRDRAFRRRRSNRLERNRTKDDGAPRGWRRPARAGARDSRAPYVAKLRRATPRDSCHDYQ